MVKHYRFRWQNDTYKLLIDEQVSFAFASDGCIPSNDLSYVCGIKDASMLHTLMIRRDVTSGKLCISAELP